MRQPDRRRHTIPTRAEVERQIEELASLYGWAHHRATPGRTLEGYADGFPNEVLLRDGRLLLLTLTHATGSLTTPEQDWVDALAAGPSVEIRVIGPQDLPSLIAELRQNADTAAAHARPARSIALVTSERKR